jgi:hypothetical protein
MFINFLKFVNNICFVSTRNWTMAKNEGLSKLNEFIK